MRTNKQRMASTVMAIAMVGTLVSFGPEINMKAQNKDTKTIIAQLERNANGNIAMKYKDESVLQPTKVNSRGAIKGASASDSSFSLVSQGKVTSVKNQGSVAACWAFGAMASLESNLLMKNYATSSVDLSEKQLVYWTWNGANSNSDKSKYAGTDSFINTDGSHTIYELGGNREYAVATLSRWYGATSDTGGLSFTSTGTSAPSASTQTESKTHVQGVNYLPEINVNGSHVSSAVTAWKQALIRDGAISAGLYYIAANLHSSGSDYYYYSGSNPAMANHEVTIVGWDDTKTVNSFLSSGGQKPSGAGAFLVKNSYGTGSGKNGYFWISYYDKSLSEGTNYLAEDQSYGTHTYNNAYQYDGTIWGDFLSQDTQKTVASNVFTARGEETLSGIGVYLPTADCKVEYKIYRESGDNQWTISGSKQMTYAGYQTIPVTSTALHQGQKYRVAVCISFTSEGKTLYFYPFESVNTDTNNSFVDVDVSPGQSYCSSSFDNKGTDVTSLANYNVDGNNVATGNATVKMYTKNGNSGVTEPTTGTTGTTAKPTTTTAKPTTTTAKPSTPTVQAKKNISYISRPANSYYNGKYQYRNLTVTSGGKRLTRNRDYTLRYYYNKNCGQASIKIQGIGNYKGTYYRYFKIYPARVAIRKLSTSKKKLKVILKKSGGGVTGYRIFYAYKKNFKGKKSKVTKKTTYTIKKLKRKKKVYVRVRAFKTIRGKKYYGPYSSIKKKKIK